MIPERLAIIDTFQSQWGERKKGDSVRIRLLTVTTIVFSVVYISITGILFAGIIGPVFGRYERFWGAGAYGVIFCANFLSTYTRDIFERTLIQHRIKIGGSQSKTRDQSYNDSLKSFIEKYDTPKKSLQSILLLILFVPIGILAIWQFLSPHPYWEYVKVPFLILHTVLLYSIIKDYLELKRNIWQVERELLSLEILS